MRRELLFVTITLLGSGLAMAACSGDDSTAPGGAVDSGTGSDTSAPVKKDSGGGTDSAPTADANGSDTSPPADANVADAKVADANVADSNATDATGSDAATLDGGVTLTVKNYLGWCSVSVNGGTMLPDAVQIVTVAPGSVPVSAMALATFELGAFPWHLTSGDQDGGGDPGTRSGTGQTTQAATTAIVAAGTPKCVWVCCETKGQTDCPPTLACP